MQRPCRHLDVERQGDIFSIRLREMRLDESALDAVGEELHALIDEDGCRKMILSLGPDEPECLYSIFLAKLISVQRRLHEQGGTLKIADASPLTMDIFEACRLKELFDFVPDRASAIAALSALAPQASMP
jgi:hypothetical protein